MRSLLISALFALSLPNSVHGQSKPLSADQISTTQTIGPDGTVISKIVSHNKYLRSSTGSVLIQKLDLKGTPISARLLDRNGANRAFEINYRQGVAEDKQVHLLSTGAKKEAAMESKAAPLATETVQGLKCQVMTLYGPGPARTRVPIGKVWIARDYDDLVVKEEVTRVTPGQATTHIVRELQNVSTSEPDKSFFSRKTQDIALAKKKGIHP